MREQPQSTAPAEAAPAAAPAPEAAAEEPPTKKVKSDGEEKTEEEGEKNMNAMFQDIDFVQDLLGGLPGVDMGDARIQEALRAVGVPTEEGEKEDEKKEEKKEEK